MKIFSKYPAEVFILLFLIITFVLSSIEKIADWKGNVNFIKNHFKDSPLKNSVPILLRIVLFTEIIACLFMVIGIYNLYTTELKTNALLGIELSALTLLFLLIGQRLAKDYAGAMSLGVYFLISVLGIYFLNK